MIIETERLILRKYTMEDVEDSYQMNLDPEVSRYTADGGVQPREVVEKRISENIIGDYGKYGFGRLAVTVKPQCDKVIGFCGLKYLPEFDEVDIGYRFAQKYWGQGIATESAKAVLKHGFEVLELKKIIGLVLPENKASSNVLKKLGLTLEKEFADETIGGLWVEWYSITFEQYQNKKTN